LHIYLVIFTPIMRYCQIWHLPFGYSVSFTSVIPLKAGWFRH